MNSVPSRHGSSIPGRSYVPLVAGLWVLMLGGARPALWFHDDSIVRPPLKQTLSPNTAPWWELTVLPRIGEIAARRIVRYRESVRDAAPIDTPPQVFRSPSDLANVYGIGPVTVERIAPLLEF